MTKRQILRWAVLLWLAPFVTAAAAAAPDLVVKDFDGKDRNVAEFIGNGKWAVVVVWAADCPICRRDIHHTVAFHHEHQKDVVVVGFSIDGYENKEHARGFVRAHKLDFPNLIGSPQDAAWIGPGLLIGTPTYYVYSPDGRFLEQRIGTMTRKQIEDWIAGLRARYAAEAGKR